jgi:hypothetical protein
MRARDGIVTSSRFERRPPGGQHKPAFKVAFGSYGAAARALRVSQMTIWRWCHDRSPLPRHVAETLADAIQNKVLEVHAAQSHLRDFLALPPQATAATVGLLRRAPSQGEEDAGDIRRLGCSTLTSGLLADVFVVVCAGWAKKAICP